MTDKHQKTTRRIFLGSAIAAMSVPMIVPRRMLAGSGQTAPSEKIRVGAIGVGNRASQLLSQLPDGAEIVALSDCNLSRADAFKSKSGGKWPVFQDYRHILDRRDIDAVIIATGEFQRVLPSIHACQAGKDVYAEKPLTLYIGEGRTLVNAARKYDRVFQVGTQQRSMEKNRVACELVRSGGLGKILEVRAINYAGASPSPSDGLPKQKIPQGLDWNMWLNQAAERPFNQQWMGWMRWQDFAGGQMTNWGAHGVDQIQWALGASQTGPVELTPLGNGQVSLKYDNGVTVNFVIEMGKGPMGGAVFIGEKGKLEINRNKFASNPPEIAMELAKKLDIVEEERKWSDSLELWQARWHLQNWLDCIRSRVRPVADVEIGHRSVSVCHLVNITRAINRPLRWDPKRETFVGDDQANQLLNLPRRKGFELPVI
ncbi:MAG: dehydrogenase [Blastopirellula sp.]|nr:MAG: dehydrogenase [Blastopirellula sp.]